MPLRGGRSTHDEAIFSLRPNISIIYVRLFILFIHFTSFVDSPSLKNKRLTYIK
jgi:hypothetical protein